MATKVQTPKIQAAHIDQFYINPENIRDIENYDVANMIAKIAALGKVIVPVFALPPDTEGEFKGKRRLIDGNRRGKSLQIISSRVNALKEGKQDVFDASVSTIEGSQGNGVKSLVEAARKFNYDAIDLNLQFIEVTKEQAEDEKEMLKLQLVTGSSAKALTPAEYAAGVLKLLAENDGNEEQTAIDIGKDKVWVQKIARVYVGINKDDKMLAAIEEGRIDVDLADQIAAFARKPTIEMPIGSAVDEVLAAANARNKVKATKKDLDTVKAVHSKPSEQAASGGATGNATGGAGESGSGGSGSGSSTDSKPIRARNDSIDTIREMVKFLTQQAQKGFADYDDAALNTLATKAESLHNQTIKLEKATKEEPKTAETPVTPATLVEPAIAPTPETPVTPVVDAPVEIAATEEDKTPVTAQ